jgi:hypothetical protein
MSLLGLGMAAGGALDALASAASLSYGPALGGGAGGGSRRDCAQHVHSRHALLS